MDDRRFHGHRDGDGDGMLLGILTIALFCMLVGVMIGLIVAS